MLSTWLSPTRGDYISPVVYLFTLAKLRPTVTDYNFYSISAAESLL
jgi:hypothetical protein